MLFSFAPWCAETCIRASEGESQKPHQGFAGQKPTLHRGIEWSKSTLALGLPEWAGKTASGPAVAANNGTKVSCAGKTVLLPGNYRVQSNANGMITAVGIPLTGSYPYTSGPVTIAPNTIVGVDWNKTER